jgi:3-methylfumaryl-CoA hydratase
MLTPQVAEWIGKEETRWDVVTHSPQARLAALLNHTDPPWQAETLPPLGHWLYGLPSAPQAELGEDGHPRLGQFLPPIPLPRRMWAAGEVEFHAPIRVGESMRKRSLIKAIDHKVGRSGELVFVKLLHEFHSSAGLAIREIQELVYREKPASNAPNPPTDPSSGEPLPRADWERTVSPDATLLFRFSAVTFNSHRIHYDREYAVHAEGYPGLVVHGPLIAMLLMDLFLRNHPGREITRFRFKAQRPLFDLQPFTICGAERAGGAELWALDALGRVAMRADLTHT